MLLAAVMRRGCVVVLLVTLALPAASAARTTVKHLRGSYGGLACATAKTCFTLSERGVTTLVNGSAKRSRVLPRFKSTRAISCAGDYCEIVGTATSKGRGVVVVLSHGKLGKARLLPLVPDVVSCPAAGDCIVAGGALGPAGELTTIAAAEVVDGKLIAKSRYVFARKVSAPSVLALSCSSPSACELVGDVLAEPAGGSANFLIGLGSRAKIGRPYFAASGDADLLSGAGGLACPIGTQTCYVTGVPRSQAQADDGMGVLYSVSVGGRSLRRVSTVQAGLDVISCLSLRYCIAGAVDQSTGTPGVIGFTNGKPGVLHLFGALESLLVNPYAGFTGLARTTMVRFIGLGPSASSGTEVVLGTV
jgi:hypothetical protein